MGHWRGASFVRWNKGRKQSFFEKKDQKTFRRLLLLFFKKKALAVFILP
jgi:hypothetical protein